MKSRSLRALKGDPIAVNPTRRCSERIRARQGGQVATSPEPATTSITFTTSSNIAGGSEPQRSEPVKGMKRKGPEMEVEGMKKQRLAEELSCEEEEEIEAEEEVCYLYTTTAQADKDGSIENDDGSSENDDSSSENDDGSNEIDDGSSENDDSSSENDDGSNEIDDGSNENNDSSSENDYSSSENDCSEEGKKSENCEKGKVASEK